MNYALQLYSVVDAMEKDFKETVRRTARLGYDGVEFAGFYGLSAEETAELLKECGLYCAGSHCGADLLNEENLAKTLAYHKAIGCQYVILPYYGFNTAEDIDRAVALLNRAGDAAAAEGMKVGYHNHQHEFSAIDGKVILDELAARTNDNVVIQLDVYWAAVAGVDPIAWMKKWGKKVELIHLRQIGTDKENVDLPDGSLDMKAVIEAAEYVKEFTVEHECPGAPEEALWKSMERNIRYLKELRLS